MRTQVEGQDPGLSFAVLQFCVEQKEEERNLNIPCWQATERTGLREQEGTGLGRGQEDPALPTDPIVRALLPWQQAAQHLEKGQCRPGQNQGPGQLWGVAGGDAKRRSLFGRERRGMSMVQPVRCMREPWILEKGPGFRFLPANWPHMNL